MISFTAVTVVLVGVLTAYAVVIGILYAFAYISRQRHTSASPTVLVPSQSQASGD